MEMGALILMIVGDFCVGVATFPEVLRKRIVFIACVPPHRQSWSRSWLSFSLPGPATSHQKIISGRVVVADLVGQKRGFYDPEGPNLTFNL